MSQSAETKSYIIPAFIAGQCGADTAVANGERQGIYCRSPFGATGTQRGFYLGALVPITFNNLALTLLGNDNTDDGADLAFQEETTDTTLVIVIDQATGDFIDLTNTHTVTTRHNFVALFYTEATSAQTVSVGGWSIRCIP